MKILDIIAVPTIDGFFCCCLENRESEENPNHNLMIRRAGLSGTLVVGIDKGYFE